MSIQGAINNAINSTGLIASISAKDIVDNYKKEKALQAKDKEIIAKIDKEYSNVEKSANELVKQAKLETEATINATDRLKASEKDNLATVQNKLTDIDENIKALEGLSVLNAQDKDFVDQFIKKYDNKGEFSKKYGKDIQDRIKYIKDRYDAYTYNKSLNSYLLNITKSNLANIEQRLIQNNIKKAKDKQAAMSNAEKDKNEFIKKYGIETFNRFKDQIDKELNNG